MRAICMHTGTTIAGKVTATQCAIQPMIRPDRASSAQDPSSVLSDESKDFPPSTTEPRNLWGAVDTSILNLGPHFIIPLLPAIRSTP